MTIDLATDGAEETRSVEAGAPLQVRIVHRHPKFDYSLSSEITPESLPALPLPAGGPKAVNFPVCQVHDYLIDDLTTNATDEKGVPGRLALAIQQAEADNCKDAMIREIEAVTSRVIDRTFTLRQGETLTVTVQRLESNKVTKTWKIHFATGASGEWRLSYGFNFIPDGDEEYFSEVNPADPTTFIVTKGADREDLDFAPSVFFTWLPRSQMGKALAVSPAAGLGFDLDNPIVFVGGGLSYHQNVTLCAGAVWHKEKRLDGRFQEGEIIHDNLESDQLESETYALSWFVGLAFRFGSSPFEKAAPPSAAGAK